jgi:hypothetical protein
MKYSLFISFVLFFGMTFQVVAAEEIVINFSAPMFARLDVESKNLLSEYAKTYPKIKDFYANIRMDVNVKTVDGSFEEDLQSLRLVLKSEGIKEDEIEDRIKQWYGSVQKEQQYEIRYRISEMYGRVDTKTSHSVMAFARGDQQPRDQPRSVDQKVGVALFTPTTGYQFSKNDPSNQYFSLNASRDFRKQNAEGIAMSPIYFDKAPFCSGETPLETVLFQSRTSKTYVLEYVRLREIEGEQVVEIRCSGANPDAFTEIRLDRITWGVKESYSRVTAMSSNDLDWREIRWYRGICTYDGIVDGVPLLKTYERSSGIIDKDTQEEKMTRQVLCEVTNLVPGPPDLSEFDVSQFLPPGVKIGEITTASFTPARIAAIVIGIILVIFGLYLRLRRVNKS